MDNADGEEAGSETDPHAVQNGVARLQDRQHNLEELQQRMTVSGRKQVCATEKSAHMMRSGRGGMVLGFHVQSAVDVETGMIVHHDVITDGADNLWLQPMVEQVQSDSADAGYYYSNGEQLAFVRSRASPLRSYLIPPKNTPYACGRAYLTCP